MAQGRGEHYPGEREDEELREELEEAIDSAHHPGPGPHGDVEGPEEPREAGEEHAG